MANKVSAVPPGFVRIRRSGWSGLIKEEYEGAPLADLFSGRAFPSPNFAGRIEEFHRNVGRTYRLTISRRGREEHFYAKSFIGSPAETIRGFFALTGAARSWAAAWALSAAGVSVPEPVGFFERGILGARTASVFIDRAVPHGVAASLQHYFIARFDREDLPPELIREKRKLIGMVAEMFRVVHGQDSIYLPDFHPHNMVLQRPPGGADRLYLVDFDEVRFGVRADDRVKNLSSLCRNAAKIQKKMSAKALTTGDRLRFLREYLGPGARPGETQALAREVLANWGLK